jgi:hypothetical protein
VLVHTISGRLIVAVLAAHLDIHLGLKFPSYPASLLGPVCKGKEGRKREFFRRTSPFFHLLLANLSEENTRNFRMGTSYALIQFGSRLH